MTPKIYTELNILLYLETHERLNFEVKYEATRKSLGAGITAFRRLYRAYKAERGV
jgi:hypothetical protein